MTVTTDDNGDLIDAEFTKPMPSIILLSKTYFQQIKFRAQLELNLTGPISRPIIDNSGPFLTRVYKREKKKK